MVIVRQAVRNLAVGLGFSLVDQTKIVTATNRFITENTNQQINELISQFFADDSITPEDATARFATIIGNSD